MISSDQLEQWEREARTAIPSALWEYCPEEFLILLKAYIELKWEMEGLQK